MKDFLIDCKDYLIVRKKYWLLPIVVFLLFLSVLIFVAETSPIAPFIYPLF